jgi:DNA polymerase III alpha subunit
MRIDKLGQNILSEVDIIDLIMRNPERSVKTTLVETGVNTDNKLELDDFPKLINYVEQNITLAEFDKLNQESWLMPHEFQDLDIVQHILDLCKTDAELQRVGEELILFQERDMLTLLKYLTYLVETMREHGIVWGVGRGSSVASYTLYLLGVHKINSMYYGLDISEFLKPLK